MQPGTVIELLAKNKQHECIYPGQRAKVWRVNADGTLYVELKCGHPWTMPSDGFGTTYKIISEPAAVETQLIHKPQKKESAMPRGKKLVEEQPVMKQAMIANSKGVIPVQGFEKEVIRFKTNLRFFENLEQEITEAKIFFRDQTEKVVENADGEVRCVEFLASDGSVVPVGLPDRSKAGNRNTIKSELISEVAKLGIDMTELDVVETESTFVLSGPFVKWMREILQANYLSQNPPLPIPEGIEEKTTTKLSTAGVTKLEAMMHEAKTDNERAAAKLILKQGIRAATVTAK